MSIKTFIYSFVFILTFYSCKEGQKNNSQQPYRAMVVSAHPQASKIGLDILRKGGTAIDASIAVQYALAVCYPVAGNLGGGGFMIYRSSDGAYDALDFREVAPQKAHRDMYLDSLGLPNEEKSLYGALAAGVPGTVKGIFMTHEKYGSLSMDILIEPSIKLAKKGFPITKQQAINFNSTREKFLKLSPENNYLTKESFWVEGDTLIQEDLSITLNDIKEHGLEGFYGGHTADKIIESMSLAECVYEGIISHQDLKDYTAVWREPITGSYKDYNFISMPLPSSGGIILTQLLKMAEQLDVFKLGHNSEGYIHYLSEMERRAYCDRAEFLGDSDFIDVDVEKLCNEEYIKGRFNTINANQATNSNDINHGNFSESEETTHFSIVDENGNAVSVTTTLNAAYGSKLFVKDRGFLLNNEMNDFSIRPGYPNLYGLLGNEANSIQAGKRMLSSMTPTIVEKKGELFMVIGSPGGSTIITSVFQQILNVIEFNMGMQESVNSPRFHHQWKPDQIYIEEERFEELLIEKLQSKGHKVKERSPIGRVDAILVLLDGSLEGGADPRGDDSKQGY